MKTIIALLALCCFMWSCGDKEPVDIANFEEI